MDIKAINGLLKKENILGIFLDWLWGLQLVVNLIIMIFIFFINFWPFLTPYGIVLRNRKSNFLQPVGHNNHTTDSY